MHRLFILAVLTALISVTIPVHSQAKGDAAVGQMTFRACATCHSLNPNENLTGPSLAHIFGRRAAVVPDFAYSQALKSSSITWNEDTLNKYLEDPRQVINGGHSTFIGVKSLADREDIIAYLEALK